MTARFTMSPKVWGPACKYCMQTDYGHEREILERGRKLCLNHDKYHFDAYIKAEMDTMDHAQLTPIGQIQYLTMIHAKTGCNCLDRFESLESDILAETHEPTNNPPNTPTSLPEGHTTQNRQIGATVTPGPQVANPPKPRSSRTTVPNRPSTIMDRLKIGPSKHR